MGAPETGNLKTSGRAAGAPPAAKANPALDAEIAAIEAELDGFFVTEAVKKAPTPATQRLDAQLAAIKDEMEDLFVPAAANSPGIEPVQEQRPRRGLLVTAILVLAAGTAYFAYHFWGVRTSPPELPRVVNAPEVTGGRIKEVAASEPPAAVVETPPKAPAAAPAAAPSRPQPIAVPRPPARAVVPTVAPAITETPAAAPARAVVPTVAPPAAPAPVVVPAAQSATPAVTPAVTPAATPTPAPAQPARTAVTHTRSAAAAEPAAAKPAPATPSTSPARAQGPACTPERAALGFCIENKTGEVK